MLKIPKGLLQSIRIDWKKWRKRFFIGIVLAFVLWIIVFFTLLITVHQYGKIDRAEESDVIIVLGAGLLRSGRPGPALTRRTNHGAELWKQGFAPYIICSGGKTEQRPRSEASACQEILLRQGIPESAILVEDQSLSTEENAIFSKQIMQAMEWETAIIVSDGYHVFRANWIFSQQDIKIVISPVSLDQSRQRNYTYSILREVAALHWQAVKTIFNLPYTHVPLV